MNGPVEIEKYNYSEFVGSDFLPCRGKIRKNSNGRFHPKCTLT
jgi:hypothetical protein